MEQARPAPPKPTSFEIDLNRNVSFSLRDRITIVGATGTGKTTLAEKILAIMMRGYPGARTYVLDSKQSGEDFTNLPGKIHSTEAPDALARAGGVQVWRPNRTPQKEYDVWLGRILDARKPAIVFIDELFAIGGTGGRTFPESYSHLMRQGRALDICVISLTQEAAYIPRTTFGQTTHIIRFGLLNAYDGREIDKILGRPKDQWGVNPPRYAFYYRRMDLDGTSRVYYYRSYKDFLRER